VIPCLAHTQIALPGSDPCLPDPSPQPAGDEAEQKLAVVPGRVGVVGPRGDDEAGGGERTRQCEKGDGEGDCDLHGEVGEVEPQEKGLECQPLAHKPIQPRQTKRREQRDAHQSAKNRRGFAQTAKIVQAAKAAAALFDQADKILPLDDHTLAAISGAYGRSIEVCRYLKHSLKYYGRMVLHEMSLDGKLMEISKALSANMANAMQGVGLFLPIVAAYDRKADAFGVYFFDGAGARFENGTYACAGSGSERIRGVFEYLDRTKNPWTERPLKDGLRSIVGMAADGLAGNHDFTGARTGVLTPKEHFHAQRNIAVPGLNSLHEKPAVGS